MRWSLIIRDRDLPPKNRTTNYVRFAEKYEEAFLWQNEAINQNKSFPSCVDQYPS